MTVYLVGAGPGDPGLLTVRGRRAAARADVVVYDRLSVAVAARPGAADGAERIPSGRRRAAPVPPGRHQRPAGRARPAAPGTVVRLKGGDPFVFARGGEEAAALAGGRRRPSRSCPASRPPSPRPPTPASRSRCGTRRPLHRGHRPRGPAAAGGHASTGRRSPALGGTILVLMGVARIATHRRAAARRRPRARHAGRGGARGAPGPSSVTVRCDARRPCRTSRVEAAGGVRRRPGRRRGAGAGSSAGRCSGERVVVTRTRPQASELSAAPARRSAPSPSRCRPSRIEPPADGGAALRAAVGRLADGAYDWLVLTSPNGVERLFADIPDARAVPGPRGRHRPGHGRRRWPSAASSPTSCRTASSPRGCSRCSRAGPGPGAPRPRRGGPRRAARRPGGGRAGRSTSSRPTAPSRPRVDPEQLDGVADADAITFTSSSTVEHFVDRGRHRPAAAGGGLHRPGHGRPRPATSASTSTSRPPSTPSTASSPPSSRLRLPIDASAATPAAATVGDRDRCGSPTIGGAASSRRRC